MEQILNNYHLEGEIGRGSFSRVYKARDLATNNHVVIKYTNLKPKPGAPSSATDPAVLKEEIEVLRKLQHQQSAHVCSIKEVMCTRDGLFVVEEFCPRGDLLSYLGTNPAITESQIRHIFWQIVKGVDHMHQIGIVHRDIKLENVMLDQSWHPKLTDFNLSAFWNKDRLLNRFCGSLSYSAPEIFMLVPYIGPELDVWSLGVMLYGLFYSKFPFVAEDGRLDTLRKKVISCQLNFPASRINDELPGPSADAIALMKSMMTVDPSQRITMEKLKRHSWFKKERDLDLVRNKKVVTNTQGTPAFGENRLRMLGEMAPKQVGDDDSKQTNVSAYEKPRLHLNIPKRTSASPRPVSPVGHLRSPRIEFQHEVKLVPAPLDEKEVVTEVLAKLEAFAGNKNAVKDLPDDKAETEIKEKDREQEKGKLKEEKLKEKRPYASDDKLKEVKKIDEGGEKKSRPRRASTGSGSRIERTKEWLKLVLNK